MAATDSQIRPLKVLAVHRYYWPDTPPYASMLRAIVSRWVSDGHQVDVLSSQPGYKPGAGIAPQAAVEMQDGARVRRLSLPHERGRPVIRLLNIFRFTMAIFVHSIWRGKYDVIMVSTAPPVVTGTIARWASKITGARLLYHCMDVHPEIGRLSGEFSRPKLFNFLQGMDAKTCQRAHTVIVLSEDMQHSIEARPNAGKPRIKIINNFMLPDFSTSQAAESAIEQPPNDDSFRLLFAGNIGRFQGLQNIIKGIAITTKKYPASNIELWLLGDGAATNELRELAGDLKDKQIKFLPHSPLAEAQQLMRNCDAGLISLTAEIYKYAYPSKTMTYLGEGCPLVVAIEEQSALARFVTSKQIGIVVSPDDPEKFADTLARFANDKTTRELMKDRAKQISDEYFAQDVALEQWSTLLAKIDSPDEHRHD